MNSGLVIIIILVFLSILTFGFILFKRRILPLIAQQQISKKHTTIRYPRFSRSKFFSQLGIFFSTAPLVSLLFEFHQGRFSFFIQHQKIPFDNLPKTFHGFKILQISDIHLGSFASNYNRLEVVVELINNEDADIICFTGDLVNNFYEETKGWETLFSKMQSKHGKYSILGNHDYGDYSNWEKSDDKSKNFEGIVSAHKKFGFSLLRNQSVPLKINGDEILLGGVENWGRSPYPKYADLSKTFAGKDPAGFKILLTHNPDHWQAEVVGKTDIALCLSGHTHGMQFGIKKTGITWSPAQYKFKYWDGLYQHNEQFLYVNRGIGYLGLPARIGMPPEITVIELVSKNSRDSGTE